MIAALICSPSAVWLGMSIYIPRTVGFVARALVYTKQQTMNYIIPAGQNIGTRIQIGVFCMRKDVVNVKLQMILIVSVITSLCAGLFIDPGAISMMKIIYENTLQTVMERI